MALAKRFAARLIGRSERTLRYWTERGYLPRRELDTADLPRLRELARTIRRGRPPKNREGRLDRGVERRLDHVPQMLVEGWAVQLSGDRDLYQEPVRRLLLDN